MQSVRLEEQLEASRRECAAISQGLVEALSAISRRSTADAPPITDNAIRDNPTAHAISGSRSISRRNTGSAFVSPDVAGIADGTGNAELQSLRQGCQSQEDHLRLQLEHLMVVEEGLSAAQQDKAAVEQVRYPHVLTHS